MPRPPAVLKEPHTMTRCVVVLLALLVACEKNPPVRLPRGASGDAGGGREAGGGAAGRGGTGGTAAAGGEGGTPGSGGAGGTVTRPPVCGNGVLEDGEACDQGFLNSDD